MNAITSSGRKLAEAVRDRRVPAFIAVLNRKPNQKVTDDALTEAGARRLADTIRGVWRAAGEVINVTVVAIHHQGNDGRSIIWAVRSDLVNGLPRRVGAHG